MRQEHFNTLGITLKKYDSLLWGCALPRMGTPALAHDLPNKNCWPIMNDGPTTGYLWVPQKEEHFTVSGHLAEKGGKFYMVLNYYDQDGKRHTPWISTGLPVKGNKRKAEAMLLECRQNFKIPGQREIISGDMLFADYMAQWLKLVRHSVSLATFASYQSQAESIIIPYFKQKKITLKNLSVSDLETFFSDQMTRGVSGNTVRHYNAVIRRALNNAIRHGDISSNPASIAEKPKEEKYMAAYYTVAEMNELLQCVNGTKLERPVVLATVFGLRRGKVVGLKWSAVDFERNTIAIKYTVTSATLSGKLVEIEQEKAKSTYSIRVLPLIPQIREMLLKWRENDEKMQRLCGSAYCGTLEYICVDDLGVRIKPTYVTQAFHRLVVKSGMKPIRFHDLRHSCASLLLLQREPLERVKEWLGHSSISITSDIYGHLDESSKLATSEAISTSGISLPGIPVSAETTVCKAKSLPRIYSPADPMAIKRMRSRREPN